MANSLVLVINCGSSSLKFALYSTQEKLELLAEGLAESLNQDQGKLSLKYLGQKAELSLDLASSSSNSHAIALQETLSALDPQFDLANNLRAVGHRVVHGGKIFSESVLITPEVLDQIRACIPLAPLHNPANVIGIESLQALFPTLPQVAVFDTAFHQTMPAHAYTYALPTELCEKHDIRRYGFHGTSHRFVSKQAASILGKSTNDTSILTAHLGNGASVAAIKNGVSVDTSMGMTPLEGLVMGTRSGDIDPGIFDFLISKGIDPSEISNILNKKSGLLGISETSNDMRTICEQAESGHKLSKLALDVFCFRAAKYLAGMMTSLDKVDALIFTGGIGENASLVRAKIINHMSVFGYAIDDNANQDKTSRRSEFSGLSIHAADSTPILVIPTDEEAMIVEDTLHVTVQK